MELRRKLIQKRQMLWNDDTPYPSVKTTDAANDSDSDNADLIDPYQGNPWLNLSFLKRRRSSIAFATPKSDKYKPTQSVTGKGDAENITNKPSQPVTRKGEAENITSKPAHPVAGKSEAKKITVKPTQPVTRKGEAENITVKPTQPVTGKGVPKKTTVKPTQPVTGKSETEKITILVDPVIDELSSLTNYKTDVLYWSKEDLAIRIPQTLSQESIVWNDEYPGCVISRCKKDEVVCGLVKISPRTIRPFTRVESKQPMHLVVIAGEIVLKTNVVCSVEIDNKIGLALKRLPFKTGDMILLPAQSLFSIENHTNSTVQLAYSFFDVR